MKNAHFVFPLLFVACGGAEYDLNEVSSEASATAPRFDGAPYSDDLARGLVDRPEQLVVWQNCSRAVLDRRAGCLYLQTVDGESSDALFLLDTPCDNGDCHLGYKVYGRVRHTAQRTENGAHVKSNVMIAGSGDDIIRFEMDTEVTFTRDGQMLVEHRAFNANKESIWEFAYSDDQPQEEGEAVTILFGGLAGAGIGATIGAGAGPGGSAAGAAIGAAAGALVTAIAVAIDGGFGPDPDEGGGDDDDTGDTGDNDIPPDTGIDEGK